MRATGNRTMTSGCAALACSVLLVCAQGVSADTIDTGELRLTYTSPWRQAGRFDNGVALEYLDGGGRRIAGRLTIWREGAKKDAAAAATRLRQLMRRGSDTATLQIGRWPAIAATTDSEVVRRMTWEESRSEIVSTQRRYWAIAVDRDVWRASLDTEVGSAALVAPAQRLLQGLELRPKVRPGPRAAEPEDEPPGAIAFGVGPGASLSRTRKELRTTVPTRVGQSAGELEVAASDDGQVVVVATNSGIFTSIDGGATFAAPVAYPLDPTPGFVRRGDPALARPRSGAFYFTYNGRFNATSVQTISLGVSPPGVVPPRFAFASHAARCPADDSFNTDQSHVAAFNIGTDPARDQVYVVWRKAVVVAGAAAATCGDNSTRQFDAFLNCSTDGGVTWARSVMISDTGMYPRVAVGVNGRVHVVLTNSRASGPIDLHTFDSCANGLDERDDSPVEIESDFVGVPCPVPGLDRCNDGNIQTGPTVTTDPQLRRRVFVTWAHRTAAGTETIFANTSLDGGRTFEGRMVLAGAAAGRRTMPWSCGIGGGLFASWYDRTNATAAQNDLTDIRVGLLDVRGFSPTEELVPLGSVSVSNGQPDQQCRLWPSAPRNLGDSENCSAQPQLAGVISPAPAGCAGAACLCDFSAALPAGSTCTTGSGAPKYGDYRGIACAGERSLIAWATSIDPRDGTPLAVLNVFFATVGVESVAIPNLCDTIGGNCEGERFNGEVVEIGCTRPDCLVPIPVPVICQRMIDCPGCDRGRCDRSIGVSISGLDSTWEVIVVDDRGKTLATAQPTAKGDRTVLVPSRRDAGEGETYMVFRPAPPATSGARQRVTIRSMRSD